MDGFWRVFLHACPSFRCRHGRHLLHKTLHGCGGSGQVDVLFVGGRLHSLVRFVAESRAELPLPTNFFSFPLFHTATGVGGGGVPGAAGLSELEKEVAADVAGLSDVFSDAEAYTSDSMPRPASVREEEDRDEDEHEGDAGEMHVFFFLCFFFALRVAKSRQVCRGIQRAQVGRWRLAAAWSNVMSLLSLSFVLAAEG